MSDENQNPAEPENKEAKGDSLDPLAKKTQELLAETKAERAKRRELEAKLAEYEGEKAKREEEEAKKRGDFEKLEAQYKTERDTIKTKYEQALIGSALKSALVEAKVAGPYLEAAEALMRAKGAALGQDDTPMIDGKPLSDYIREWAASDAGKAFVSAPNSSGGGASGGSAAGNQKTMTRAAFDALSPNEKMAFSTSGGRLIDKS